MTDFCKMNRVLCGHSWNAPEEWASALNELANLSDEQIQDLSGTSSSNQSQRLSARFPFCVMPTNR